MSIIIHCKYVEIYVHQSLQQNLIRLFSQYVALFKPTIHAKKSEEMFPVHQGEDFSYPYNVSSYPKSDIEWLRSKNGMKYELIARCSREFQSCENYGNNKNINITRTSFGLKNLKFPQDDPIYYKCNASNELGNDSITFKIQVYGKMIFLFSYWRFVYLSYV